MRKIYGLLPLFMLLISFSHGYRATAQSCCPEFELQFQSFRCEAPDCAQSTAGVPGISATMCQYSTNNIQVVPGITPGFTYSWVVTGGTINGNVLTSLTTSTSYIDVTWGNGSTGSVTVTIYNNDSSCFQVLTQNFCLTKSPKAQFIKNTGDTVCNSQSITFTNTSLGAYTSWFWDFGDGNSQNGGMTATHSYSASGTYVVSLTVSNAKGQSNCGCSNTFYDTIVVNNNTGLEILTPDCRKMLCAGDTVTYCASITTCTSYNWSAPGGTVIGSGSCIRVVWDNLSPSIVNPTVTLIVPPSCAGTCGNTVSLVEKILYNGMPIQGSNNICVNSSASFTLPTLPGVFYTWNILPAAGVSIFNGTNLNTPSISATFSVPGTYTISCSYIDSLRDCKGTSTMTVQVRPSFSIVGPTTSCATCTSTFSTLPSGNFNWSINTVPVSTGTGPTYNKVWGITQTGTFVLTATQIGTTFCNSPQQSVIVVAPKPVLTIQKSTNVACPGTVVKFWVTTNVTDMNITWSYPPGTLVLNNTGPILDTIYLSFTGPGTKTVTATQQCKYSCTSTSISTSVGNPPPPVLASPQTTVCIDQVVTYNVASPVPGVTYTWSINNPNLGTIQSGQGSPTVTILWHGNATNTGVLTVRHCGGVATANITVTLPLAVSITQTGSCFSSGVGYTLTANPSGQTYLWSTGATTQSINITSPGLYTVTVNPGAGGSCPVTKSINVPGDGYELGIAPPCIVTNCNLSSFSIPLTQIKFNMPCAATIQWYFKPVGGTVFTPISGATSANYNATQLGCYRSVATCANGCNITSNTICIPEDIYFCCTSVSCSSLTFGIDFTQTGCNPTSFSGFYTGTGSPTGNFPIYYCYGDGTSDLLPTLNVQHQYAVAGQYPVCISTKTLVFNPISGTNDTCCISNCRTIDVPVVARLNASYNCNTGLLAMSDASSYFPNSTGATYSWSVTGGTFTGVLGNTTSNTITPTSSGNFVITLTVTKGSCTSSFTHTVPVNIPNAAFTVNPNPTCSKDITYFNAASGNASYVWQFGDGAYSYAFPASLPQHAYTNNTNTPISFTASLTITTLDGCMATSTQVVSVHPKPIVTVTPNPSTICRGGSVLLTANINPNGNTMCTSYSYQWIKDGTNIPGANASTYAATDYGLYSVFVSGATPGCNCTMTSDTAIVMLYPDPVAKIKTPSTICFDPASNPWSFSLNAASFAGYTYNWSASIGGISFSPNGSNTGSTLATGTLVDNSSFVIYLQVTDANGCVAYDSLCMYPYANPTVSINATGSLCANSINTLSVIAPAPSHSYLWINNASGPSITTTLPGLYNTTATNLLTGCSAMSNSIFINQTPNLQLFPIGCDTICSDGYISIPLAQLPNLSSYLVNWYSGIKPAGTLIFSGNGAITLPANVLGLGLHNLWTTASFPNGCEDSSGVFQVFIKNCCQCAGGSWAFREYSIDNGAGWKNLNCSGQEEVVIACNPITVNAAYNCSPTGCSGNVTGQLLDNLGNVILNIPSLPYTYTPTPGTSGTVFIRLFGWCDGVKCDSCTQMVYYNCPALEPPCVCDSTFKFTGQPIIVVPNAGDHTLAAVGNQVPMNCGMTYPNSLQCQKPYQFYINYQHPWPSGNCQTMVVGEVILDGGVVFSQTNVSPANPLTYTFTGQGLYCVKFKLMVNGIACDSCIVCFKVDCQVFCDCKEEFHFSGPPIIKGKLGGGHATRAIINVPPPINCNTSLARPLMCNTSYDFSINFTNPYQLPCVAKDSAVIVKVGSPVPLVINPNTTTANPISYTFTSSGTYCVKHYLTVNGIVCDSCIVCFSVECPNPCNCNSFDFLGDPTINFSMGRIKTVPVYSSITSPCNTSTASELQCRREYRFFINAGAIGANLPDQCNATVTATLLLNNVSIATMSNVSQSNPLIYTFNRAGIYCIRYDLYVNGVFCKSCTQCFSVKCCPIYTTLPALKGNFTGCVLGGTTQVFNDSTGGVFSSMDTTVAKVDKNGVVTAVGYGRTVIVYRWIKHPCDFYAIAEYHVPELTPLPAITGSGAICKPGDSTRLLNAITNGVWSTSNSSVAFVSTGNTSNRATQVIGRSRGIANITYTTVQSGCPVSTSREVIVQSTLMNPITGPSEVCIGRSIQLMNNTPIPAGYRAAWSSSNKRVTVNETGLVNGLLSGRAVIRYQLTYENPVYGACSSVSSRDINVLTLPVTPSITYQSWPRLATGTTNICSNQTFNLRANISGGFWSASGSVSVNSSGVVTTFTTGLGTVTYTVFNSSGCSRSRTLSFQVVSCDLSGKQPATPQLSVKNSDQQQENKNRIIVYPNPARDKVYFNVDVSTGEGVVMLTDLSGKELALARFNTGTNYLETGRYAAGIYILIFRTRQGIQTEKLLIE